MGPGIYLQDNMEVCLFNAWLALPHPDIPLAALLALYIRDQLLPPRTAEVEAAVAAKITPEQEKRFALFVGMN